MLADLLATDLASYFTPPKLYAQLALLFYVFGFLTRDELVLRGLVLAGTFFYVVYYYTVSDAPLWEAIIGSGLIATANIYSGILIMRERSTWGMSPEMAALYGRFATLSPGHFRRIMKNSVWKAYEVDTPLLAEGQPVTQLYYLRSGHARLERKGKVSTVEQGHFLGELGFLRGSAASASVIICEGAELIIWERDQLKRIMTKSPEISNAIVALFNQDLAGKLSISWPERS